jgi:hypothetical protein
MARRKSTDLAPRSRSAPQVVSPSAATRAAAKAPVTVLARRSSSADQRQRSPSTVAGRVHTERIAFDARAAELGTTRSASDPDNPHVAAPSASSLNLC